MRWSYKTVHYELKKEGLLGSSFLDESEIELSLNQYGRAGWELVSMLETQDGVIAVFKQPLSMDVSHSFKIDAENVNHNGLMEEVSITTPAEMEIIERVDLEEGSAEGTIEIVEEEIEAPVLDDFEVVDIDLEDKEKLKEKPKIPRRDVGSIRIE